MNTLQYLGEPIPPSDFEIVEVDVPVGSNAA